MTSLNFLVGLTDLLVLPFRLLEQITVEEIINSGNRTVNIWGIVGNYKVPIPYLRPRVLNKGQPEPGKSSRFVPALGDGPEYKFAKTGKGLSLKGTSYGKDAKGKGPPVSYLPLREWAPKKDKKIENKQEKGAKTERGSFIDTIFFNAKKYNNPGPGKYFATEKKDDKDRGKLKDKKKIERPNFLYDCEYLGLNTPGPGTYKLKDTWIATERKRITTADDKKRQVYVPQAWKAKHNQGNGPGQYEITRLLNVKEEKGKTVRDIVHIPIYERTKLGIINKVRIQFN